jgi:hypothetical protein
MRDILNFQTPEIFKLRYGRNPKTWTITMLYDLWLRASARSEARRQKLLDYTQHLVKEIPANKDGNHIIYFYSDHWDKNEIYCYKFSKFLYRAKHTYGVSSSQLSLKNRKEVLEFILSNDKAFEIGQEYDRLNRLMSHWHYMVWSVMEKMVAEQLKNHFKELGAYPTETFAVTIAGEKYFINAIDKFGNGHFEFKICNKFNEIQDIELV